MNRGHWLWLWGPVALYIGLIFWLSSAPRPIPGIDQFPWLDKVIHTIEYAPLGSLMSRAFRRSLRSVSWRWVQILSFIGYIVVGASDEFYQSFIPTRISSVWDAFWDGVGGTLGQCLYRWISHKTP